MRHVRHQASGRATRRRAIGFALAAAAIGMAAGVGAAGCGRRGEPARESAAAKANVDWAAYGGGPESRRYAALDQITRENVRQLAVAWTYDSGENGGLQTNPIVIDGVVYTTTPTHKVVALDAATGALKWRFDSGLDSRGANRGVTYWRDPAAAAGTPVAAAAATATATSPATATGTVSPTAAATGTVADAARVEAPAPAPGNAGAKASATPAIVARIFAAVGSYVYALDATTGRPIPSFGEPGQGRIDLRADLGRPAEAQSIRLTTPGLVYKDLLIVGGRVSEGLPATPGDVRAYDARTGALRWSFHTIPHPGEFGYETWPKDAWTYTGGANNWPGMALDEARGIVYVPTGSAAADFYGANRHGDNLFANSLLALDANTGKRVWHFQAVHHDIWDRDFPSAPTLVTVTRNGRRIDAVAQTTKHGYVFLFDRTNGEPLFPIESRRFPASTLDGERTADTQPLPLKPAPFARQQLTVDQLTTRTPAAHAAALAAFRTFRNDGLFVPFVVGKDTLVFPGFDGGAEWGGSAFDPDTGLLYVNANEMAWTGRLEPNESGAGGRQTYLRDCAACHRDDMKGTPPQIPSLVGIASRRAPEDLSRIIRQGSGRMPGFPTLSGPALESLVDYLLTGHSRPAPSSDRADHTTSTPAPGAAATAGDARGRVGARPDAGHVAGVGAAAGPGARAGADAGAGTAAARAGAARAGVDADASPIALKYRFTGYKKFLDPDGYPAIAPPWGTLNAIDLNTGEYAWKIPLGEYPELVAQGLKDTGSENYGGPVVTSGGLVFIGATNFDKKVRAFDKTTGKLLWEATLPFSATGTPATYQVAGRQFLIVPAGGGKDRQGQPSGGMYVAFALPAQPASARP